MSLKLRPCVSKVTYIDMQRAFFFFERIEVSHLALFFCLIDRHFAQFDTVEDPGGDEWRDLSAEPASTFDPCVG